MSDPKRIEGLRLLLVDDEPNVLESLEVVLAELGSVDCCSSAERALIRLERGAYDVVIADYGLPGMNGADLLQASFARRPDVAGLLITGSDDYYALGKRRGYHVLLKPVEPARLCGTVLQLAQLSRMKRSVEVARGSLPRKGVA
jgi:DNA-binding NtrC family response regulator